MRGRKGKMLYSQIREIEYVWERIREADACGQSMVNFAFRFKTTPQEFKNTGFNVIESGCQQMKIVLKRAK